jgi:hypothetical protein
MSDIIIQNVLADRYACEVVILIFVLFQVDFCCIFLYFPSESYLNYTCVMYLSYCSASLVIYVPEKRHYLSNRWDRVLTKASHLERSRASLYL